MSGGNSFDAMSAVEIRCLLDEFYAEYVHCLDEDQIERWPDFFTEDCFYQLIPRENYDQGLPIALIRCESKGYLKDRVAAVRETSMYAPYTQRHFVSGLRVTGIADGIIKAEANFSILRTQTDKLTEVFLSGRYLDTIVMEDDKPLFSEKICVCDSTLIPNSLVIPV